MTRSESRSGCTEPNILVSIILAYLLIQVKDHKAGVEEIGSRLTVCCTAACQSSLPVRFSLDRLPTAIPSAYSYAKRATLTNTERMTHSILACLNWQ